MSDITTVRGEREQRIATEITRLWSQWGCANLQFELATGKAIIDGLHRGRVDAWRKRRKSHPSLRKISDLLDHVRSPPQLYYAACAYALTHKHPDVLTFEHLKANHLHAVAGLPDQQAMELLERAAREKQSVRNLRDFAAGMRTRGKGGRPATPEALRKLRQASRMALPVNDADVESLLKSVEPEERLELLFALQRVSWRSLELSAIARRALPSRSRVLVVDAEDPWRHAIAQWLCQAGYAVQAIATAAEAGALPTGNGVFDVAVVGNGMEEARRLLTEVCVERVLLVVGSLAEEDAERGIGEVVDRFQLPGALYRQLDAIEKALVEPLQLENPTKRQGARRKRP